MFFPLLFTFVVSIISGDRNNDGSDKALLTILYVWYDYDVNLDDNGGWSCDF